MSASPPTASEEVRIPSTKMSAGEIRGGELVCRLVAATPPYLYSPAGLPHCFFFSELLRGMVRAKRPLSPPPQQQCPKRFRAGGHTSAFGAPPRGGGGGSGPGPGPLSTARILPALRRIYQGIAERRPEPKEPLPAVIGLELVVDYVKHEREPKQPVE